MASEERALLRIGELSRRVGVSDHVLRAWENRYGLLRPIRSAGGFRLYTDADEARVRRMRAHLGDGLSAAEAARAALAEEPESSTGAPAPPASPRPGAELRELGDALRRALDDFDEPGAQAVFDRLLTELTVTSVLRDVVLPYLRHLGERWAEGSASVAQEHFASNLIRGRVAGLARGWGTGQGPRALLATPPGELHELALMMFGVALDRAGWRVDYLGVSTPMDDLAKVADELRPSLVVLASTIPDHFADVRSDLAELSRKAPLALAGSGADAELADDVGARFLDGDPVTAASRVTGSAPAVGER